MKKLVFIPAWNEQDSIEAVIGDVREHLPGTDLLVVDDGSTDQTAARARDAGAKVASLPFNQGVGAAHQTAYIYAIAQMVVVFIAWFALRRGQRLQGDLGPTSRPEAVQPAGLDLDPTAVH